MIERTSELPWLFRWRWCWICLFVVDGFGLCLDLMKFDVRRKLSGKQIYRFLIPKCMD